MSDQDIIEVLNNINDELIKNKLNTETFNLLYPNVVKADNTNTQLRFFLIIDELIKIQSHCNIVTQDITKIDDITNVTHICDLIDTLIYKVEHN